MGFYRALHINDLVTAIYTGSGEILYLIEGKERALLVDTSLGVRGLKELVHSLTYKPVTAALTHGHVDHALGAPEFEEVYLASADIPLYRSHCPLEVRKEYLEGSIASAADLPKDEDFVPPCPEYPFKELEEGMVFDLGEVHVEAYALPGHTPGTFVFLLREYKILILGDACNNFTFLFDKEALSVEEYEENLKRLAEKLQGRYSRTFLCHGSMEGSRELLEEAIALCGEIKAGRTDDVPFRFMGTEACIARRVNERMEREDGIFANIIYNKNKIWKNKS